MLKFNCISIIFNLFGNIIAFLYFRSLIKLDMNTKQSVIDLVNIAFRKGIRKIVFSSGSRNAPLIVAFNEHGGFNTFSIHDERSAAFFALGMAQQTGETVAIACTSGSAALNYAPAIAEAYYQRIPLLVITADRPLEWIDQGEGQTMRQRNIYANFIKSSYEIFQETIHPDELRYNTRMFNEAINITQIAPPGPVHVNIPLREPLYTMGHDNFDNRLEIIDNISPLPELSDDILDSLADIWNRSKRKLILTGILPEDIELKKIIKVLSDDPSVIVMTETTSNIYDPDFINNIDRFIMSIDEDERYSPDLLLTLGSNIVSKKIKYLLRKWNPVEHWDVDESDKIIDTYKSLTKHIKSELKSLLSGLNKRKIKNNSDYKNIYMQQEVRVKSKHKEFFETANWSDLKAYYIINEYFPENINLQMANSTAVRYAQLMKPRADILYNSNRGVAGIDGCTSTAGGASIVNDRMTVLVTGDVAFLYDSNALWNKYVASNFKIIVFNNEGGNIFRFIPGPPETKQLEEFFEAHHNIKAEFIAKAFDINYSSVTDEKELISVLPGFFKKQNNGRPSILEIFTPRLKNMDILRDYFTYLR